MNYAELKTAVLAFVPRSDIEQSLDTFIDLAEAQMNRRLDCRQMEETITISLSGESYPLPCGFAGVKSLRIDGTPAVPLAYVLPSELDSSFGQGRPWRYTISGESLVFDPPPDASYEVRLRYRKRVPSLSASNTCNWLLEDHPDAYLYGVLLQTAPFIGDDARLAVWSRLYEAAISDINADDKRQSQPANTNARGRQF